VSLSRWQLDFKGSLKGAMEEARIPLEYRFPDNTRPRLYFWRSLWDICTAETDSHDLPKNPIMELLPGGTLRERLDERSRLIRQSSEHLRDSSARPDYFGIADLIESERYLLHDWAAQYGFLTTDGFPPEWLLSLARHVLSLPTDSGSGGGESGEQRDYSGDAGQSPSSRKPRPLMRPGAVYFVVRSPRGGKMSERWKRSEKKRFREFLDRLEFPERKRPPKPRATKKGKKYESWHYKALALRFCGLSQGEVKEAIALEGTHITENAVRQAWRVAASEVGLKVPPRVRRSAKR